VKVDLTLPEPPSANRYWRLARGRAYLSAEAKAYKQEVLIRAIAAGVPYGRVPFEAGTPVRVTLRWYRSRRAGDLDNRAKVALDALNNVLWLDDKQVVELHLYRYDRPGDGALYVTVED
jgi:crossover junction endodeoxyribonuclease RusA